MLVLLLGPSGVGKSSIISNLVQNYNWVPIISWITREERANELFKVSISSKSYEMLATNDLLWSDVRQLGHCYGLLRNEINAALSDRSRFHIVDYGLAARTKYFSDVEHMVLYLTTDTEATLRTRITTAGRPERIQSAIHTQQELDIWYAEIGLREGAKRVLNGTDRIDEVSAEINQIADTWAGKLVVPVSKFT